MSEIPSYRDPSHPRNGPKHHTGARCVEGCGRPAGTAWSPFWCQPCNAERIERVQMALETAANRVD
jgi:hypothetical protein